MRYKIGGQRLKELGSSRFTDDVDYLINDDESKEMFIHDSESDLINANGHGLFLDAWNLMEDGNEGQALLELKAFAFVQHCLNMKWDKVDSCEFDMKFICRKFNLSSVKYVQKYCTTGEIMEVVKVINSIKR